MAAISPSYQAAPGLLSRLIRRPTSFIGLAVLAIIALAAILAPLIAPFSPTKLSVANRLKGPSLLHLFGTDDLGRDIFTRMLYAAQTSLSVGLAVVVLASLIPEKAQAILTRASLYGENRILCGFHFRSDVAAGQQFGSVLAVEMLHHPVFQGWFKEAKAELKAAGLTR